MLTQPFPIPSHIPMISEVVLTQDSMTGIWTGYYELIAGGVFPIWNSRRARKNWASLDTAVRYIRRIGFLGRIVLEHNDTARSADDLPLFSSLGCSDAIQD